MQRDTSKSNGSGSDAAAEVMQSNAALCLAGVGMTL